MSRVKLGCKQLTLGFTTDDVQFMLSGHTSCSIFCYKLTVSACITRSLCVMHVVLHISFTVAYFNICFFFRLYANLQKHTIQKMIFFHNFIT